jgi:hypothetical protein
MHIDKVANETTKYYEDIKGEHAKTYHFHKSSYEDSLRKDTKHHFKSYKDTEDNDYLNKLYGIPKGLKFADNDNTLYYEKNLGKQTEFDFATKNWSNQVNEKEKSLQEVLLHLQNNYSGRNHNKIEHNTVTRNEEISNNVKVAPSFRANKNNAFPQPVVQVSPAFSLEKVVAKKDATQKSLADLGQQTLKEVKSTETINKMGKLAQKIVHRKNMKVIKDKIYHKDYDKERSESNIFEHLQETETLSPKKQKQQRKKEEKAAAKATTVTTRSQSLPSTKTPRTPPQKGKK